MKLQTLEARVARLNEVTGDEYRIGKAYGYYYLERVYPSGGTERVAEGGTKLEVFKQIQAMLYVLMET